MFCNQCGTEQTTAANYCPLCGRKYFHGVSTPQPIAKPRTPAVAPRAAPGSSTSVLAQLDVQLGAVAWDAAVVWLLTSASVRLEPTLRAFGKSGNSLSYRPRTTQCDSVRKPCGVAVNRRVVSSNLA